MEPGRRFGSEISPYDAIIAGGGPAGATAAILLAQAGWKTVVVEKRSFPRRKVCGEFISAASWPLLRELGVTNTLLSLAGPDVQLVGLYAGKCVLEARMPTLNGSAEAWGRALGREYLDAVLLARARQVGAEVMQPWTLARAERVASDHLCTITEKSEAGDQGSVRQIRAPILIAAHGSWETGVLPTQLRRYPRRGSDLFAFKARFRGAHLEPGTMPLVIFPDGYGGMVHTDGGRVSLSCCIRRDALARYRRKAGDGASARAAEAVFDHLRTACRGVRVALSGATLDGAWLSAGPIRPGIRSFRQAGVFAIGNAAGEAHPIVAEGISMAIQSAWLLCQHLTARSDAIQNSNDVEMLEAVRRAYERRWHRNFAARIRAASLLAHLAMRPTAAGTMAAIVQRIPTLLTLGARWSGKAQPLLGVGDVDAWPQKRRVTYLPIRRDLH